MQEPAPHEKRPFEEAGEEYGGRVPPEGGFREKEEKNALGDKVTMIMATSPVKSNPSTELLEQTMRSIRLFCKGTQKLPKIILCDGYTLTTQTGQGTARKGRRITREKAEDYKEYLRRIQAHIDDGNANFEGCKMLILPKLHGFGLAMQEAIKLVKTPYILVAQHDRAFISRGEDLKTLVNLLDEEKDINYIGYLTHRQINYCSRMMSQHQLRIHPIKRQGIELVPLIHFLDSMHLARTSFWEYMFSTGTIKIRDFPEHTFGNVQRWDIVKHGMKEFGKYGTYLLWDGVCCIKHVNGRTFLDEKQRLAKGLPGLGALQTGFSQLKIELDKEEKNQKSSTTRPPVSTSTLPVSTSTATSTPSVFTSTATSTPSVFTSTATSTPLVSTSTAASSPLVSTSTAMSTPLVSTSIAASTATSTATSTPPVPKSTASVSAIVRSDDDQRPEAEGKI
ncbi:hypothetical protein AAMO2058_000035600 [Amorphochlora amoebiformis]